jgi:hypothetical protein
VPTLLRAFLHSSCISSSSSPLAFNYFHNTPTYISFSSNGNVNVQEQDGEAVERVDAARASPGSDAASSMQQPQTARERELEAEVQILKAKLEATAKIAAQPPDLSPHQSKRYAEWLEVDGFLEGLRAMDDKALREIFQRFADIQREAENSAATEAATDDVSDNAADAEATEKAAAEAETDKRRLSKEGLAKMFETKNITLSKGKLEELMSRIDTNGNGEIDWLEFRALARSYSDLEMFFKGLPLERVLAACFARGAVDQSIEAFFSQKHSDVVVGVLKAGHILEAMITGHIKKQNEATKARASQEQAAGGAKYGAELKGGTVEKFFEGVTGLCGEPHPGVCVCVCVCVCTRTNIPLSHEHACPENSRD